MFENSECKVASVAEYLRCREESADSWSSMTKPAEAPKPSLQLTCWLHVKFSLALASYR